VTANDRKLLPLWALCGGVALVLGGLRLIQESRQYDAAALVRCNWGLTNEPAVTSYGGPDISTDLELIRSEAVLKKAVALLDSDSAWPGQIKPGAGSEVAEVRHMLLPRRVGQTNIIEIAASSPDPAQAAAVANAVAAAFAAFRQSEWREERFAISNALVVEVEKLGPGIADAEARLRQTGGLSDEADPSASSPASQAAPSATQPADDKLNIEREAQLVANQNLLASLDALNPVRRRSALSLLISDTALANFTQQLAAAQARLTAIQLDPKATAADIASQQDAVAALQRQADARADQLVFEIKSRVESLKADLDAARAKRDAALRQASDRAAAVRQSAEVANELAGLKRDRAEVQRRMDAETAAAGLTQVEILERAVPSAPIGGSLIQTAWGAIAVGVALAVSSLILLIRRQPAT
jgi:succinoglycan biosynthesis transport protein ExoP